MSPNSYDVSAKMKEKETQKKINLSVIKLPGDDGLRTLSFEQVLREIGFGKVQLQLLLLVMLILMQVINETMGISYIVPAAACDLNLSTSDKGLLSGMTFLGIMTSSYISGYLGDTQGRRRIMLISLLCATTSTITSAFLKSFTLFCICRFVTGIFVSGYSATIYAYVGEFNTNKNRATVISWVSVAVGAASTFLPLCALWILQYEWRFELYEGYEFRPWRLLILIYATPGLIGTVWLYCLPESPKYMLSQGKQKEALEIVSWMYRTNKSKGNYDDMRLGKIISEQNEATSGKSYKGAKAIMMSLVNQTLPLIKPPYLLYFFACSLLHFGTFAVAGGMALFLPDTLNRLYKARAEGNGTEVKICDVMQMSNEVNTNNDPTVVVLEDICDDSVDPSVFIDSAYIGVAILLSFIILSLIIKPLGRRPIFVFSLLSAGLSGFIVTFVTSHYLIIIFYCAFILFCGINVSLINGAACDIFPTHLRAMTVCVSMMFGRLGSAASTNLIGYSLERNCELTYYSLASLLLVCLAVSFLLPSRAPKDDLGGK